VGLQGLDDLPTLPSVAVEVLNQASDPSVEMDQIAQTIQRDMALAIRVLKVANSPFYGARRAVTTVREAALRLGLDSLKSIVLSVSVAESFQPLRGIQSLKQLWHHSLWEAIGAKRIMEQICPKEAETAFIAGLLHDVGQLILWMYAGEEMERLAKESLEEPVPLVLREVEAFGVDHGTVGKWLLERWGLPDVLRDAVWLHHQPSIYMEDRPGYRIAGVLQVLEDLSPDGEENGDIDPRWMERWGYTLERLREITSSLEEEVSQIASSLPQVGSDSPEYVRSLQNANRTLGRMGVSFDQERRMILKERDQKDWMLSIASRLVEVRETEDVLRILCQGIAEGWKAAYVYCDHYKKEDRVVRAQIHRKGDGRWEEATVTEMGRGEGIDLGKERCTILEMGVGRTVVGWPANGMDAKKQESLRMMVHIGRLALERALMYKQMREQGEQLAIETLKAKYAHRRAEKLHAQLVEAEKLRAMGQMASGVAHDLNNLLGAILPCAQLIKLRVDDKEMVARYADQIQESSEKAAELVDRLSSLAKGETHKVVVLGADESVEEVIGSNVTP